MATFTRLVSMVWINDYGITFWEAEFWWSFPGMVGANLSGGQRQRLSLAR